MGYDPLEIPGATKPYLAGGISKYFSLVSIEESFVKIDILLFYVDYAYFALKSAVINITICNELICQNSTM